MGIIFPDSDFII